MAKDAIALLKDDHKAVKGLLEKLTKTTNGARKSRQDLLEKIATELKIHTTLEEEIFYPAFQKAGGAEHNKMNFEAREEHRVVEKLVLPDLEKTGPETDQFAGRAKVLKELVEHHADEEEDSMFPMARKALSAADLRSLGEAMEKRKSELKKKMKA